MAWRDPRLRALGVTGQWASGARTVRSGPRVSEGALRERSRGSRREVEEGKWSEGAERRALLVRSRRAHRSEVPGVLGWAPRVWAARGIRPGKRGRGGGDGLAAGCWAASGKKGKRAGPGCRLGLGRVGVGFGLGSFL